MAHAAVPSAFPARPRCRVARRRVRLTATDWRPGTPQERRGGSKGPPAGGQALGEVNQLRQDRPGYARGEEAPMP
eukprot:7295090-Pyramimonas_sp.AAC.1